MSTYDDFYAAEARLSTLSPASATGRAIFKFDASTTTRIPLHIRTGQMSFGDPSERKRFQQIEFHGKGTVFCRVYVDGVWIVDASATMTESPSKDRRVGIPVGTRGYTVDLEFSGDGDIRAVEFSFTPMSSTS